MQRPQRQKHLRQWTARSRAHLAEPPQRWPSATRNAVVAYAKQFLGNPYVYGGTSLTSGADCSGFTQSVFAHFGISTEEAPGIRLPEESPYQSVMPSREICCSMPAAITLTMWPSTSAAAGYPRQQPHHGICITPANYRTPCKAVTFWIKRLTGKK